MPGIGTPIGVGRSPVTCAAGVAEKGEDEQPVSPPARPKFQSGEAFGAPCGRMSQGTVAGRRAGTRPAAALISYSGGGRNTTSCLAESATTSGGFCSFMPWIAQNRS